MNTRAPIGFLSTLEEILLPQAGPARSIWPSHWVKMQGSRPVPDVKAPKVAFILPVRVLGYANVPRPDFWLRSAAPRGAVEELIRPDLDNAAYVNRWMRVAHSIHDPLLVRSTAPVVGDGATSNDILQCWFFYPDPELHPELWSDEVCPC